ncbi:hypothetical protein AAG906_017412 [Vitis piasezkii]
MIIRFTDIVNGLEALGNTYKESEKVMKILRSLPSKWHTKVTTIQEAKYLTKLPLEELIGSLMTYEINLAKKQQEGVEKKKKSIALKVTTKEEEEVEEEKQSEEDEDLALITRKFNKFMRGERRDEKRKRTWCVSSARNWDTLNMIVLFTRGSKKDKRFLDSGCSRHMTRDESKFSFLTKKNGGYVTFEDNAK